MLEGLIISQGLLWLVIIIQSLVCFALARQVGVIYERIAPAGALAVNRQLVGGDKAPELSVPTLNGAFISIGSFSDNQKSQLIFFLSPDCPICKTLLPVLKSLSRDEASWLNIILASDGGVEDTHRNFVDQQQLGQFSYVLSEELGMSYGVSKLPYAVLVDENGTISALGMVNSREHLESLFEAKWLGKSTIQDYLDEIREESESSLDVSSKLQSASNSHP